MALDVTLSALVSLVVIGVLVAREVSHRQEIARLRDELGRANTKLVERHDLAAVGEMVSSLAQELKTPLQEVLGNTELMLATSSRAAGASPQPDEELRQIRDGAERAADIVRNLVAFTETVSLSRRWHDVNEIIDRAVDASRHDLLAHGVRVERGPAERLPMVYVDGRQLEKVFASLIARAAHGDALAPAGAARRPVVVSVAVVRITAPDDRVIFTIADTGPFSGADQSGAENLGASRRVVEAHGGLLTTPPLTTESGARVVIELPIAASAASAARTAQENPRSWTESSISSTSTAKSISTN